MATETSSKIRYPRVLVDRQSLEILSDEAILSIYAVPGDLLNSTGAHAFCSYCGVHVLYSPTIDQPEKVWINVDCLSDQFIESVVYLPPQAATTTQRAIDQSAGRRGMGAFQTSLITINKFIKNFPGPRYSVVEELLGFFGLRPSKPPEIKQLVDEALVEEHENETSSASESSTSDVFEISSWDPDRDDSSLLSLYISHESSLASLNHQEPMRDKKEAAIVEPMHHELRKHLLHHLHSK